MTDRVKYSFYIDGDTKEALDARAEISGRSTSDIVRSMLAEGLGHPCTGLDDIMVSEGSLGA